MEGKGLCEKRRRAGPGFEVRAREVHSDMGGVQSWENEKTMVGGIMGDEAGGVAGSVP